jgi:hypothetical protein
VLARGDQEASRLCLYSGTGERRLCGRWVGCAAAILCALAVSGCSYRLTSLLTKDDSDVESTGSINRPGDAGGAKADASPPPEADLAYARAAVSDVLSHGKKDSSAPWENPETGASGNITPLGVSRDEGGLSCRDFLVSYVRAGSEAWLEGVACRSKHEAWDVKSLKPLKRS